MSKTTYALTALPHRSIPNTKVINLRTITNRKPRYKSLAINIQAKNWDQKNQKVKGGQRGEPNADLINEKIHKMLLQAQTQQNTLIGKRENSFIDNAYQIIEATHTTGTRQNRIRAVRKLQQYLQKKNYQDLSFNQFDTALVEAYYRWLLHEGKLKTSTANEYMQILNQVVDKIIMSGRYQFKVHPFMTYQRKRTSNLTEVLSSGELKKLMSYQPKSDKQQQALNIFFFMMHMAGMRISDALTLCFKNYFFDEKDRLMVKYKSQKSGKVVTTKVTIKAALYTTFFLDEYLKDEKLAKLYGLMHSHEKLLEQLATITEERDSIIPFNLGYLWRSYEEEPNVTSHLALLEREAKKEDRKEYLRFEAIRLEQKAENLNHEILKMVGDLLIDIKDAHPNHTIIPLMRGIYNGEEKMSDEVEAVCNAFKVKNNQSLKRIATKLGIKKKMSNHQARHIFAMRLFTKGVNMHHISLALGHSNIATTDKYRMKLIDDKVHDITDEFSSTFEEI